MAAAFIGPGTVTVCTLTGISFGYSLLWAMSLSILATIVLQEMSARLGVVTQKGLAEHIRNEIRHPIVKYIALFLVLSAIFIGNAAYEAGNITGGVLGIETVFGEKKFEIFSIEINSYVIAMGILAFIALYVGSYKVIERILTLLVVLMSLAFVSTAIITQPEISQILSGLFTPSIQKKSVLTILGLIGTTVVPYNLFLHASLAKTKWKSTSQLSYARLDTIIAVALGGIVSMAIIVSAANLPLNDVANASDLARSLEPIFGKNAKYMLSVGLFAAGLTSAITAPLAAAYVVSGCLGWSSNLKSYHFRFSWILVLGLGVGLSAMDFKPINVIKFAQVTNGLLLPIIALFLLWIMNKTGILGKYVNSKIQNVLGISIVILTVVLGVKSILGAVNIL